MCGPHTVDSAERGQLCKGFVEQLNSSTHLEWPIVGAKVHGYTIIIQHDYYSIPIKLKVLCLLSRMYCESKVIER